MKRILSPRLQLSVFLVLLSSFANGQDVIRDRRQAVVFIKTLPSDYKTGDEGTGFIIHPAGYVLTAKHVIENASENQIEIHIGERDGEPSKATAI